MNPALKGSEDQINLLSDGKGNTVPLKARLWECSRPG